MTTKCAICLEDIREAMRPGGMNQVRLHGKDLCAGCLYTGLQQLENKRQADRVKQYGREDKPTFAVLLLEPQPKPIYFIVATKDYAHHGNEKLGTAAYFDHQRYFFEEHSCPTNFIGGEEIVSCDPDDGKWRTDPHDLLGYCGEWLANDDGSLPRESLDQLLSHLNKYE